MTTYGNRLYNMANFSVLAWLVFAGWWVFGNTPVNSGKPGNLKYLLLIAVFVNLYTISRGTVYFELDDEGLAIKNYLQPWVNQYVALTAITAITVKKVAGGGQLMYLEQVGQPIRPCPSAIMRKADWELFFEDLAGKGVVVSFME